MIVWLNNNQGFAMSLLTLVYVVATMIIVIYNRKTIKEMQKTREAESRPYVFVSLEKDPRDSWFSLRIKNYGKTGAIVRSVEIIPTPKFVDEARPEDFLADVVIAPLQSLEFYLIENEDETISKGYSVSVQYITVDDKEKCYNDNYSVALQYANQMAYSEYNTSGTNPEANALRTIANHLDSIKRKI